MIYLYWYLGVGAAVLAIVFGVHRLTTKNESDSLSDLLDAVNPERKKLSYRILNNFVAPALAAVAVVVVWPVAVYMKCKEVFAKRGASALEEVREFAVEEVREFAVERAHLHEPLTVAQIEVREVVTDPMEAVPNLPFGHLNAAWKTFMEGVGARDELWSFTAPWHTTWARAEIRTGYVVVHEGVPGSYFLTMCKDIEDEPFAGKALQAVRATATRLSQ